MINLRAAVAYTRGYNKALLNSKGPIVAKFKFPDSG